MVGQLQDRRRFKLCRIRTSLLIKQELYYFLFKITGPDKWAKDFPVADGPRQSPINIVPTEAQYDPSLKGLKLKYNQSNAKGILNNGHSFQVDFVDDTDSSSKGHKSHNFM